MQVYRVVLDYQKKYATRYKIKVINAENMIMAIKEAQEEYKEAEIKEVKLISSSAVVTF